MLRDIDDRLEDAGATSDELKRLLKVDGAYEGVLWDEHDRLVESIESGIGPRAAAFDIRQKRSA